MYNSFTERAEEYGLAVKGFSTHAAFFDYDHDGDLDMFLLSNSFKPIGSFNLQQNERREKRFKAGNDLTSWNNKENKSKNQQHFDLKDSTIKSEI